MREKARQTERLNWQSIVEHIATLPRFSAEQEITLYDSDHRVAGSSPAGCKLSSGAAFVAIVRA
jgi:hypothetical protein